MNDVKLKLPAFCPQAFVQNLRRGLRASAFVAAILFAFQAPAQVIYGTDFGPYTDFQNPTVNPAISAATITARLQPVVPYTKWIRTYGSTNGLENIPQIARSMGLKVAAEAWIGSNPALNAQEIANLIVNGQRGLINVAIVGSEALLNGYVSASTLIGYIQQVQQALPSIPVTTADVPYVLLENPSVMAACSFVAIDEYPYWEDVSITSALAQTITDYKNVVQNAGGKQVWIAEAGWPSAGDTEGSAVASPANAGKYLLDFVNWANGANVPYFLFEAEDEPWAALDQGPQGGAWGLLTDTAQVKPWVQPVLASNGMTCGTSTPTIQISYIAPYASSGNIEGNACGLRADSVSAVGYLSVAGEWWVKPYADSYLEMPDAGDGYFSIAVDTGGIDYDALLYALFVVPDSYTPPELLGASSLPASLTSNAVASVQVSRSVNSISGQILDSEGNPLSGVQLSLTGSDTATTTTPLDGMWSFSFADSGAHTVKPSLQNYSFSPPLAMIPSSSGGQVVTFTGTSLTTIFVQPASLEFSSYTPGGPAPSTLELQIATMSPASGVYYTALPNANCNWLTVTAATGFTPQVLQLSANTSNLAMGTYTCNIAVSAGNVNTTVPVSLAVVGAPTTISLAPTNITFPTYSVGGPAPAAQSIMITSTNPASGVAFTAELGVGCGWLNLSTTSGSTPETIQASVDSPLPQSQGTLTCSISFVSGTAVSQVNLNLPVVPATMNSLTILSAASGVSALAPGSLATAYGTDLATSSGNATAIPLPITLNGTSVSILDAAGTTTAAPLVFVSPQQVNYLIPDTVAIGAATLQVTSGDGTKSSGQIKLATVAPAVFTIGSGNLVAADGLCVSANGTQMLENVYQLLGGSIQSAPLNLAACAQTVLEIFATGLDTVTTSNVQVIFGATQGQVIYAGPQGSFIGLDQVNVLVPASLAGSGNIPIVLTAKGQSANTVMVTIQ